MPKINEQYYVKFDISESDDSVAVVMIMTDSQMDDRSHTYTNVNCITGKTAIDVYELITNNKVRVPLMPIFCPVCDERVILGHQLCYDCEQDTTALMYNSNGKIISRKEKK